MPSHKIIPHTFPWPIPSGWAAMHRGSWPAQWIRVSGHEKRPLLACYRLKLELPVAATVRIFCTGDERYELFLDGERLGRGPERGDPDNWYVDAYDLDLSAGTHMLVARVWSAGMFTSPWSHVSLCHGFILAPADMDWLDRFATGRSPWEALALDGFTHGTGLPGMRGAWHVDECFDGLRFPWGAEYGAGEGWSKPEIGAEGRNKFHVSWKHTWEHQLRLGELPAQRKTISKPGHIAAVDLTALEQATTTIFSAKNQDLGILHAAKALLSNTPYHIAANSNIRILIDLETYRCAFQHLVVSGGRGSRIEAAMDESLVSLTRTTEGKDTVLKGPRQEIEGKILRAAGVVWTLDGGQHRHLEYLWWRSGCFVRLSIATADEPLCIEAWYLEETGYPLDDHGSFVSDVPALDGLMPLSVRTLAACQHESFMDCPFYEQQLWVGDMLPQVMATLVMTNDDRLIRRCLRFLADSRWTSEGLVGGRYPAPQKLSIPSFALWWIHMVAQYAWWRGDQAFIRTLMPAARASVEHILSYQGTDGLIAGVPGWDFTDWVEGWTMGDPPGSPASTLLSLLASVTLDRLAEVEDWLGEAELATRNHRLSAGLWLACRQQRFDTKRGRFIDQPDGSTACEHTQAVAALSPRLDLELATSLKKSLEHDQDLARCSVFFDHHLIEAYARLGMDQAIIQRYQGYDFQAQGLTTTPEHRNNTRSDCHAWSSHVRYHSVATILGIRPADWGFATVLIRPHPGELRRVCGTMPYGQHGTIAADFHLDGMVLKGTVLLPQGLNGILQWQGQTIELHAGMQSVQI